VSYVVNVGISFGRRTKKRYLGKGKMTLEY